MCPQHACCVAIARDRVTVGNMPSGTKATIIPMAKMKLSGRLTPATSTATAIPVRGPAHPTSSRARLSWMGERMRIKAPKVPMMKPTAVLINTARGPIVDPNALYNSLKEKRIFAAKEAEARRAVDALAAAAERFRETSGGYPRTLAELAGRPGLAIRGLMAGPPPVDDPEDARPYFRRLRDLRERLVAGGAPTALLRELSMGMSHDFEIAIQEGAAGDQDKLADESGLARGQDVGEPRPPGVTDEVQLLEPEFVADGGYFRHEARQHRIPFEVRHLVRVARTELVVHDHRPRCGDAGQRRGIEAAR